MRRATPFASAVLVSFTACRPDNPSLDAPGWIRHPQDRYLWHPLGVASRADLLAPPVTQHYLFRTLTNATAAVVVGSLDGSSEEVFGQIEDIVIDQSGRIYVLDSYNHEVRVFDGEGSFLGRVGTPGTGPGEFSYPRALALAGKTLYVTDRARIHAFRWVGDRLEFVASRQYGFEPFDACVIGEQLYAHGISPPSEGIVHALDVAGVIASFGRVYTHPSSFLRYHAERSRIACMSSAALVLIAPESLLGEVHGYTADGVLQWTVAVEGYRPIDARHRPNGATGVVVPESGYDRVYGLTEVDSATALLQIAYTSMADAEARLEFTELRTFAVDFVREQLVPMGSGIPRIMAFRGGVFVSLRRDPYPQIGIHRMGP